MNEGPLEVYFDAHCPLCRTLVHHLERFDHTASLHWIPLEHAELPIDPSQLSQELHTRDRRGIIASGAQSCLDIIQRLPQLRWLAPLLKWALQSGIAEPAYRWVARHRMGWRR
jgi:predicted DCC family thiol-disulfide oxidoreductase YuxK